MKALIIAGALNTMIEGSNEKELLQNYLNAFGTPMSLPMFIQESVEQVNDVEGKNYNPKMSLKEFVEFLVKEEIIKMSE